MSAQPIELDERRGAAAKKATQARRRLAGVGIIQCSPEARQKELETQLIGLLAAAPVTRDPQRMKLIAAVIEDMRRLSGTDAEGGTIEPRAFARNETQKLEIWKMTTRTKDTVVRFRHPFSLKGVDRKLPPGEYRVATEEEAIEGLSFLAYRRVSTSIILPTRSDHSAPVRLDHSLSVEMMPVDPVDLQRALEQDGL